MQHSKFKPRVIRDNKRELKWESKAWEHFEDLRELIMDFVRGKKPAAVETYAQGGEEEEEDINLKMLNELVKIRELLEHSSRK